MVIRQPDQDHKEINLPTIKNAKVRRYFDDLARRKRHDKTDPWLRVTLREWEKQPNVNGANRTPPVRKPFRRKDLDDEEDCADGGDHEILDARA